MQTPVPSMSQLLMADPGIPFQVRAALRAAAEAKDPRLAEAWRRRAAFVLGSAFDLDECEQYALVDLESECDRSIAA